ncbi:MAG: polymer-forming cytoskeletal protein [Hyphomicrobiaceae bacterium]|nr:polymer-forming cytoskeletal protein [Hyphomicrobiaceae bacterium]
MRFSVLGALGAFVMLLAAPAAADDSYAIGGDVFVGGADASVAETVKNDAFAMGNNVSVSANVGGDVHSIGNTVTISGAVTGNVYAAGNNVTVSGNVFKDASVAGANVTLSGARVAGNVRAAGQNVTIGANVEGSAVVAAETLHLNSPVTGDLNFTGRNIVFGNDARVDGKILIRAEEEIAVPASVASADRVTFEKAQFTDMAGQAGHMAEQTSQQALPQPIRGFGFLAALFVIGILYIALFRRNAENSFSAFREHPWRSGFIGIFSLGAFVGIIPVLLATIIGIPFALVAVAWLVLMAFVGFAAGAYFIARWVFEAFNQNTESMWMKALALAAGLVLVWAIGLLPFVGWILKVLVVFAGLGGIGLAWVQSTARKTSIEAPAAA